MFSRNIEGQNSLSELVENLCFAVTLYRKAAFFSHDTHIQAMLLDMADQRDMALARALPYAGLQERTLRFRQNITHAQNKKMSKLIEVIGKDPDMVIVKQLEGETLALLERLHTSIDTALVKYMLHDFIEIFERQLDNLFSDDSCVA